MRTGKLFLLGLTIQLIALSGQAQVLDSSSKWTWVAGQSGISHRGVGGTKGTEGATVLPSARFGHIGWTDTAGNLWLFGGDFNNSNRLNDLWRFNTTTKYWMWKDGPFNAGNNDGFNQFGKYGTINVPAGPDTNWPGARRGSVAWKDAKGKFWLFGGWGRAASGGDTYLADLWTYDPGAHQWTWISGPSTGNYAGGYVSKGTPSTSNSPRARGGAYASGSASAWVDAAGNFWIFGGYAYNKAGTTLQQLNDLWQFNPTTGEWTWWGGSDETNDVGVWGTKGTPSTNNIPSARYAAMYWKGKDGKFWLFGGYGVDKNGTTGRLNDTWCFDPVTKEWTWVHGNDVVDGLGVYGDRGVAASSNIPGARFAAGVGDNWVDANGKLWLFGGNGFGAAGAGSLLQDVWCFDPATKMWTWMRGSDVASAAAGTYTGGSLTPGGRHSFARWMDLNGNFWVYGGIATTNSKSDLWLLEGVPMPAPAQPGLYTTAKANVCVGESNVTYTVPSVAGATSYEWTYTGTGGATLAAATTTGPTNTVSFAGPAGSGKLSVRAANASGQSAYRDTTVTVNALPTVSSSNTGARAICQGDSLQLTATATGVTYEWKNGATVVGTSATYYAKTAGTYTVTVTSTTTNCAATSTPATTLTVNALPTVTTSNTGAQTICQGDSLQLTATATGVTYEWKNGNTVVGTNATYYAKTSGDYTVTVTSTTTNCAATSAPATNLTVNALPTVTATNTGAQAICQGDSLQLTATITGGPVTYEWLLGGMVVGNNDTYYASVAGNYTVRVTNTTTNCAATSTPATVLTVNSLPSATVTASGPTDVCSGDSVVLTAGAGTGYAYQWKNGTSNVGSGNDQYVAYSTGNYSVVVTDGSTGCKDSTQEVSVIVHSRPVVTLTPGDTAFCEGGVVTLEVATADTGLTYVWKNNGAIIPLASAYFMEVDETGAYRVIVGRSQINNCEDSTNEVTVTVYPLPVVNLTWDHADIHATPGYASYQWYSGGQPIAGATDSVFHPNTNGGYSVMVTDANGCSAMSPVYNVTVGVDDVTMVATMVRVFPNPTAGEVHVEAPIPVNLMLTGIDGRLLQQHTDGRIIDMRTYPAGVYLLRITNSNGMFIRNERIVKQDI
jgi:N-acetylneuraminic acid mutarotase